MLPVQPYREGSYPPGTKFPQFGDDVIGGYLNAHAALAEKRRNMVPFHIGRLQQDGLVPRIIWKRRPPRRVQTQKANSSTAGRLLHHPHVGDAECKSPKEKGLRSDTENR